MKPSVSKKVNPFPDERPFIFWFTSGLVFMFLFISPFQKALFNGNSPDFEQPIYVFILLGSIGLLLLAVDSFFRFSHSDGIQWKKGVVWLIPLSYLIALKSAASLHQALIMLFLHVVYAALFVWASQFTKSSRGAAMLMHMILFSGVLIVIFGLLNWFGVSHYQDAVLDYRLSSVFQYPNSYAAYLMALLLGTLTLTVHSKRCFVAGAYALLLLPVIISFLLTLSRGALLILPIVILLLLPFCSLFRQILFLCYMFFAGIATVFTYEPVIQIGVSLQQAYSPSLFLRGVLIVLGASVGTAIITGVVHRFVIKYEVYLERRLHVTGGRFIFPVVAIMVGLFVVLALSGNRQVIEMLPTMLKNRIESINLQDSSVLERGTFYRDAIAVIMDYPVFGAGGGAWAVLYEKYQSNPYISRQAHNYFLQTFTEVGIAGGLILLLFIIWVYISFIRDYIRGHGENKKYSLFFFIVSLSVLIHSMVDFNMSFVYLAALVYLCLGATAATRTESIVLPNNNFLIKGYKFFPILICFLAIFISFASIRLLQGNSAYQKALTIAQTDNRLDKILEPLDQAIGYNSAHPVYTLLKTDLLFQVYNQTNNEEYYKQAFESIQALKSKEAFNRRIFETEYNLYVRKGELEKALNLAVEASDNFPWEQSIYDRIISLSLQLGITALQAGDSAAKNQYWDQAIIYYELVASNVEKLEELPNEMGQSRPFGITDQMAYSIGYIYFSRAEYEASVQALVLGKRENFEDDLQRNITRLYLASLEKLGRSDRLLYDLFVKEYPEEVGNINALLEQ